MIEQKKVFLSNCDDIKKKNASLYTMNCELMLITYGGLIGG